MKEELTQRRFGVATMADIAGLTGRQILERMLAGDLPASPIARTLTFWLAEVGDGLVTFEGEPSADYLNPLGIVHGGWALTIIDSATGCAGHTTLAPGQSYTSIETKVNFSRAIRPETGLVRCTGRVVTRGSRIITCEATLAGTDGKTLAHGTSTLMVLEAKP